MTGLMKGQFRLLFQDRNSAVRKSLHKAVTRRQPNNSPSNHNDVRVVPGHDPLPQCQVDDGGVRRPTASPPSIRLCYHNLPLRRQMPIAIAIMAQSGSHEVYA